MATIYHFTSGVNAGGSGPWDTGRAGVFLKAQPTTRQQMFDAIVEALSGVTGAGWTETAASTASERVFTSPGESGNENLVLTMQQGPPPADPRYIQFGCAPKVDAGGAPDAAIGFGSSAPTAAQNLIDFLTSDFTMEFQIVATLDFIWVFVSRQSNQQAWTLFGGVLTRAGYNTNVLQVNTGGATAGSNVLIPTTVNPATVGYRIGDPVQIVEEGAAASPVAETCSVVAVESTGLRVRTLQNSYTADSRIGQMPNPMFVGHWNGNSTFETSVSSSLSTSRLRSCFRWTTPESPVSDLHRNNVGSAEEFRGAGGYQFHFLTLGRQRDSGSTDFGLGVSAQPEIRTNVFLCPTIAVFEGATSTPLGSQPESGLENKAIMGLLPGLYVYPGIASFFLHDNFLRSRNVTTNEDYVPVRFAGSSTGSNEHFMLGPTPGP